ncbi:MAG: hypothetical protein ACKOGB_00595, partial [Betaproteobacteria bacterium]
MAIKEFTANKAEGDAVHIEIERTTQVMVDTVRQAVDERLGPLMPAKNPEGKARRKVRRPGRS